MLRQLVGDSCSRPVFQLAGGQLQLVIDIGAVVLVAIKILVTVAVFYSDAVGLVRGIAITIITGLIGRGFDKCLGVVGGHGKLVRGGPAFTLVLEHNGLTGTQLRAIVFCLGRVLRDHDLIQRACKGIALSECKLEGANDVSILRRVIFIITILGSIIFDRF